MSCLPGPAAPGAEAVARFSADPSSLMARNVLGGQALTNEVRMLAASDVATADSLIAIAAGMPVPIQRAIGRGLASAAHACVIAHPELAAILQEKVAASGEAQLQASFSADGSDVATNALEDPSAGLVVDGVPAADGVAPIGSDGVGVGGGSAAAAGTGDASAGVTASRTVSNASTSSSLDDGANFLSGLSPRSNGSSSQNNDSDSAPLSPTR